MIPSRAGGRQAPKMTGQHGLSYRDLAMASGFARLIQPWPTVEKYPMPKPIVMARCRGQMELFPLPVPRRVAYQLQLPLIGGRSWHLLGRRRTATDLHATGSGSAGLLEATCGQFASPGRWPFNARMPVLTRRRYPDAKRGVC